MNYTAINSRRGWTEDVKQARRELVLQAASEEFADKGLEGATMRGVALRAGCTTGAIYPLFDSKDAIYAALLAQSLSRLEACIADAVVAGGSARLRVEGSCRAFLAYYLRNPLEVNLGLYLFRGLKRQGVGKDTDRALNALLLNVLDRIAEPLAEVRGEDRVAVQPWLALLFSQMIGALVLHLAGRLHILDTEPTTLLNLMLAGLNEYENQQAESARHVGRVRAKKLNQKEKRHGES
jgi:AcrR family transcriptional regulator